MAANLRSDELLAHKTRVAGYFIAVLPTKKGRLDDRAALLRSLPCINLPAVAVLTQAAGGLEVWSDSWPSEPRPR